MKFIFRFRIGSRARVRIMGKIRLKLGVKLVWKLHLVLARGFRLVFRD